MPHSWRKALDAYRYPVDLRRFTPGPVDASLDEVLRTKELSGWFELSIDSGDPQQTRDFEKRFRERAPCHLEAWAEVVYWKLYFRRGIAQNAATAVLRSEVSPCDLWSSCNDYIETPNRTTFSAFRKQLFRTPVAATAATFPAFICPDAFPMVDTQIAAWLRENGPDHGYPCDVRVPEGNIKERHWPFVEAWIQWCQATAHKLCQRTEFAWRARDVEMAVFSAQRHKPPLALCRLT